MPTVAPAALVLPPVPPQEERRLVTALFCDLVGFTPLSESLDPEEVRDIQSDYFSRMAEQIERYGGTVEKYAGDAVLALFGAPIAHEDDAERAVLCALGMQAAIEPVAATARARWNVEPAIRVGVNTGEVVSGTWNASGRQDVAVTGDAVNTAARLQAAADAGEVLVGTETMRLTRRRIVYGEKRELVLKGKTRTVPAWPAVDVREQLGERWEAHATRLVGRDRELEQLLDAWGRAQSGEGQFVTLVGDPGVGKSRLIAELIEQITAESAIRVVRARCLSYGQEIALWLIADLLRTIVGVREQASLDEVRVKVGVALDTLLERCNRETRADALDVLGEVLGLQPGASAMANAGAEMRRSALLRHLRLVLGALSERAPTLLVLEDLHWTDDASQEVLKEVLSDVPGLRLLVLAAQRPGWTPPWSEWGWTERLTVRPLRDADAAVLAGAVLGDRALSRELEQYVADRAGGNPFFVEEMLRALDETNGLVERAGEIHLASGAADRLPTTLTEILLARLDRLESQVRGIAQVASVIGRNFAVPLLATVAGREQTALETSLTALQHAEIAFPHRSGDLEYMFKHVSMRDVAYNTLVQKRRQDLHLATARAIAALYPSDEYVEIIAFHYSKTAEHAEAATWLERAGDRAVSVYANEPAVSHYTEARQRLETMEAQDRDLARLNEKLVQVLLITRRTEAGLDALNRAVDLYIKVGDLEGAGRATALLVGVHGSEVRHDEQIVRIRDMVERLQGSGPSPALASLYMSLVPTYFYTGQHTDMLSAADQARRIAEALGDRRLHGGAWLERGLALSTMGDPGEARRAYEMALPLLEEAGDLLALSRALILVGEEARNHGGLEAAWRYEERALEVATRAGGPESFIHGNLGQILLYLGDWKRARDHAERGIAVIEKHGQTSPGSNAHATLSWLSLWSGKWDEAAQLLEADLEATEQTGNLYMQTILAIMLAELDIEQGRPQKALSRLEPYDRDSGMERVPFLTTLSLACLRGGEEEGVDRAEALAREAVSLARTKRHQLYLADALRAHGAALGRQVRYEEAQQILKEGMALARSMPYPYAEARSLFEMGMVFTQRRMPDQARPQLEEALVIFRRLGAMKDVERTERALSGLT